MTDPGAVALPLWGKIAVVVAGILLIVVFVTSVDFGGDDERDRPNLIGFDTTTVTR